MPVLRTVIAGVVLAASSFLVTGKALAQSYCMSDMNRCLSGCRSTGSSGGYYNEMRCSAGDTRCIQRLQQSRADAQRQAQQALDRCRRSCGQEMQQCNLRELQASLDESRRQSEARTAERRMREAAAEEARQAEFERQQAAAAAATRQAELDRLQAQRQNNPAAGPSNNAQASSSQRQAGGSASEQASMSKIQPLLNASCIQPETDNRGTYLRNRCDRPLMVLFCLENKSGGSAIAKCGSDFGGNLFLPDKPIFIATHEVTFSRVHVIVCDSKYPFFSEPRWTGRGIAAVGCSH